MGRFTFTCPITGETQTISGVAPGANVRPRYSARCTAEEVSKYEREQKQRAHAQKVSWEPSHDRHPHQEEPPNHT